MKELLEELSRKYQQILDGIDIESIKKVIRVLEERRRNINDGTDVNLYEQIENLGTDEKKIFELMELYNDEIKQKFIDEKEKIIHITDVAPENMVDGKIVRSINRANHYETERGNWVFASSSPINGTNPYIARSPGKGMIIIAKNTYIYGGDNMEIQQDEQGNNRVVLKHPNYIYEINPQNFTPVVTLKIDQFGKPYFAFSEEWISERDVDINDSNQVIGIKRISDITDVIRNLQVLCDVNMTGEAWKIRSIRSSGSKEDAINYLRESIREGKLRYINGEAGININNIIYNSQIVSYNNIQQNNGNSENGERD